MKTQLTIEQALAEGFTLCGYANRGWQSAIDINDIGSHEVNVVNGRIVLFSKEFSTPSTSAKDLNDLISDYLDDNWSSETGDDTNEVLETIKAIDFSDIAELINEKLSKHKCYKLTDIELIP